MDFVVKDKCNIIQNFIVKGKEYMHFCKNVLKSKSNMNELPLKRKIKHPISPAPSISGTIILKNPKKRLSNMAVQLP